MSPTLTVITMLMATMVIGYLFCVAYITYLIRAKGGIKRKVDEVTNGRIRIHYSVEKPEPKKTKKVAPPPQIKTREGLIDDDFVCDECGSDLVESVMWVAANYEQDVIGPYGEGIGYNWCPECENHCEIITYKEYVINKK